MLLVDCVHSNCLISDEAKTKSNVLLPLSCQIAIILQWLCKLVTMLSKASSLLFISRTWVLQSPYYTEFNVFVQHISYFCIVFLPQVFLPLLIGCFEKILVYFMPFFLFISLILNCVIQVFRHSSYFNTSVVLSFIKIFAWFYSIWPIVWF